MKKNIICDADKHVVNGVCVCRSGFELDNLHVSCVPSAQSEIPKKQATCGNNTHQMEEQCMCDESYVLMPDGLSCTYSCQYENLTLDLSGKRCVSQCGPYQMAVYSSDIYDLMCFCVDKIANLPRTQCVSACDAGQ